MRTSQLYNAKAVATKAGEEAEELYAISVTEHKTAKGRGAIEIMVPRSLRNLLIKFEREVRHLLAPMSKKIDDYLFVTNDTGEMMTRVDSAVGIFRKEVGCVNIMTAKSFRQYFATKAQNSDDPITRERMPIHMGHSQNTVQTYYLRRPERRREHVQMLEEIGGLTVAAANVDDPEGIQEDRNRRYQEVRDAEEAQRIEEQNANFYQHPRRVFTHFERQVIRQTFAHLPEGRNTLCREHIDDALENNAEFKAMYDKHLKQEGSDGKVRTKLNNSFHAQRRKKN